MLKPDSRRVAIDPPPAAEARRSGRGHRTLFGRIAWMTALGCGLLLLATGPGWGQSARGSARRLHSLAKYTEQHAELQKKFAKSLEEVAEFCDEHELESAARQVRALAVPMESDTVRVIPLPRQVQPPLAGNVTGDERTWRSQLEHHRQDYAKDLYFMSRRALKDGHVAYAYDLVREAGLHDSDHVPVRKILGFVRNGNEWVSEFEDRKLKDKKVWHDRFGWIPKDHVAQYLQGQRYCNKKWMTAAKEAEIRRDWFNAWEVETEHYRIKTNHSLERGVELAKKLEDFHGLFFQTFVGFFNTPDQAQQLFEGKDLRAGRKRPAQHRIYYLRNRDEYIAHVKRETDQAVEITKGIFFPKSGVAFFYFDEDDDDDTTVYHEATHQLLSGGRPQTVSVGERSDFWIIEGIACYMESFRRDDDRVSIGVLPQPRIEAACVNYLQDRYYVPLRDLTAMGMAAFQTDKEIRRNYSQSAALTHFFMHYDGGRYREALIEHLTQIYSPKTPLRRSPDSLAELTGVEFEELDLQFQKYLQTISTPARAQVAE